MIRALFLLQILSLAQVKNALRLQLRRRWLTVLVLTTMVVLFYVGFWKLSSLLMTYIYRQEFFGVILSTKLIQIMLMICSGIVIMSALTTALASFFVSLDLEFHFSLPVPFPSWMTYRFLQVYLQSCWMVLAFGSPFVWAFLTLSEVSIPVRVLGILVFAAVCSLPVSLSCVLCMLLVRIFPARRLQQVVLVLSIAMASVLVFLFRAMQPEQMIGPGGIDVFRGYVDLVDTESQSWNPAKWGADTITALSQEEWREAIRISGPLMVSILAAFGLYLTAGLSLYRRSWDRALQALSGENHDPRPDRKDKPLSMLLTHPRVYWEAREALLFVRNPSQWSQIFVLASLLVLYLFSIHKLPLDPFGGSRFLMALGNTAFVDFVVLSIASRFVFTSFSMEGMNFWMLKTLPQSWGAWIRAKILVFGIPVLCFGLVLTLGSGLLLSLDARQLITTAAYTLWDGLLIILFCVAFGLVFIDPKTENPLKLIVSPGGLLLMATILFMAFLHVVMRLAFHDEALNYFLHYWGFPNLQGWRFLPAWVMVSAVEIAVPGFMIRQSLMKL